MNLVKQYFFLSLLISPFSHAETLTILNWEEYLSQDVIERWEEATGHTIKQIYFDSDEQRDSMLVSYENGDIDIAIIDETASRTYGANKILIAPNQESTVPNLKHIDSFWGERCSQYSVPYLYGTVGIAYRTDKVAQAPSSWWDLLNPNESLRGHISLLNESADTLLPVLIVRGHSNNTGNKEELKQAFLDTEKMLPFIKTFEYPITYLGANPNDNDLHMSLAYSGDQYTHNEIQKTENWDFVIPKEGSVIWTDCLGVLSSSSKQALAFEFINYLNQPEIAALNSEEIYLATPNLAAKALQSNEIVNDETVYLHEEVVKNAYFYEKLDTDNLKLRNRIIQSLLVKYEAQ